MENFKISKSNYQDWLVVSFIIIIIAMGTSSIIEMQYRQDTGIYRDIQIFFLNILKATGILTCIFTIIFFNSSVRYASTFLSLGLCLYLLSKTPNSFDVYLLIAGIILSIVSITFNVIKKIENFTYIISSIILLILLYICFHIEMYQEKIIKPILNLFA